MNVKSLRRGITVVGATLVSAVLLASCAGGETTVEAPTALAPEPIVEAALEPIVADVNFALYPGYLDIITTNVFDIFTTANPDSSVVGIEGPASQTYAQLLASPVGSPNVHGGMMNDTLSWSGVNDGMWQQMTVESVPNLGTVPESLRNDAGVPWGFNAFGITYNPDKIDKIDSWEDLYDPALKGRVAMWPGYFDAYLMAAVAAGASETEIEVGIEAWAKAKDNIGMWITSVADLHQAIDAGEIWAAPDWLGTAVRDANAGMNLAFSIPKEGAALNTYQLVVADGITPEETRAMVSMVDLSLAEQNQNAAFEQLFLTPANGTVKVDASLATIRGLEGYGFTAQEAEERFYALDYEWVGRNTEMIKKLIENRLQ